MDNSKYFKYSKLKAITLMFIIFCNCCLYATAYTKSIGVYLDKKKLMFDVNPKLQNNRVLVPFRTIFEAFGATVSFEPTTQTVVATNNGIKIVLYVNSKKASVDGSIYNLDTPSIIEDGRTLVPLRFISEALGYVVKWDSQKQTVSITSIRDDSIKVVEIKGEKFESSVLKSKNHVFVDIYASWCAPCKTISPIIEEVAKEMMGTIKFYKIDGDVEEKKLKALGVTFPYYPTLRVYKNGEIVQEINPKADKKYLKEQINIALSK